MTSSSRTSDDKLERLIAQVGRLTEAVTVGFHDSRDEFQNFREELAELKEITRQQTENTTRLVRIVEMLIQKNGGNASDE
jgi:ABC-type transporter Mla subunit MlaD